VIGGAGAGAGAGAGGDATKSFRGVFFARTLPFTATTPAITAAGTPPALFDCDLEENVDATASTPVRLFAIFTPEVTVSCLPLPICILTAHNYEGN
jgi:hypothetical protein